MRTPGKKLICYTSRKPSHLRKEISPENKNSCRVSFNSRRCNFKSQFHGNKVGISKIILTRTELSAKRPSSSRLPGRKTSCFGHRGHRKNAARNGAIREKEKRKRGKRGKRKKNSGHDEAFRLQSRARYLLIKMKSEQNLIDAYSQDGWKGQSREKIKPEKELQRAEKQILKCKLGIRDAIRQLAVLSSEGSIQDPVIYPDETVFHEHIFCAKCKKTEAFPENDIIQCYGTCNCGFHQRCLNPPLEKIPPGDHGWLCKFCKCKKEILEAINAYLGTCFTVNSNWEDIFKEATCSPDAKNGFLHPDEEWPSEDSDDEDYFPERTENSNTRIGTEESISESACSSNGLFCSSDEANRSALHSFEEESQNHVYTSSIISIDSDEASNHEITSYRRQRRDVDYKKLHDEMFGKEPSENEQPTEDEDWGPHRKKQKRTGSDDFTTLVDRRDEAGCSNMVSDEKSSRIKRPIFRIPPNAVEKLRQVFSENELPSRVVKENLSKQLGISSDKITRWFKNTRYAALKSRKGEILEQPQINTTSKRSTTSTIKNQRSSDITSMDESCLLPLSSIIRIPRNLKRILRRRKATKPITTTPLRKQHKAPANTLPSNKVQKLRTVSTEEQFPLISAKCNLSREPGLTYHQVNTWFTSAIHHKRQGYHIGISQKEVMTYNEELCLVEIERLCCLEERVQNLRKALVESENNNHVSRKTHSREERVIYVPVAEVKEKV